MTRQDRHLEARAEQLDRSSRQLNMMIAAVLFMILFSVVLMFLFYYLGRTKQRKNNLDSLLQPLEQWRADNLLANNALDEKYEEINEAYALNVIHIANNKKQNLENRAKIFLVNSIMPFIDRMIHEVNRLKNADEPANVRAERYNYVAELTDKINDYNNVLTQWIQLRKGDLSMHVESFPLQETFDVVQKGRMSFQLKGINLEVEPTELTVKADRVLTLFMLNTLADNARKFTPEGGTVNIFSSSTDEYVEISVKDTGKGMSVEELSGIFDHKVYNGHGFGLMNCKGIIEKYRKMSQIFNVCKLSAESEEGKGSRFFFRLPHGVVRMVMVLFMAFSAQYMCAVETPQKKASVYADSAYYSNINGNYEKTLQFSDSVRKYLNLRYKQLKPEGKILMARDGDTKTEPAEITWFRDGIDIDYDVILDIRNESAVAALALHDWSLYRYNNRIYTMLFKEKSADKSLAEYCRAMQTSESNKSIAVAMLVLLLILILIAYYFLYYRHRINYSYCMEQVGYINDILLSERSDEEKLSLIKPISTSKYPESLREIVGKVRAALESSVKNSKEKQDSIELAEDERRRAELEDDKLHVSNNVLDNCLSTLKHETMYYPSRIRQIVDEMNDGNTSEEPKRLQAIDELVAYYKELYGILSAQAMRQVNAVKNKCQVVSVNEIMNIKEEGVYAMGDPLMLKHLFDTLQKQNNAPFASVSITQKEGYYLVFRLGMENLKFREFFVPSMQNIPFLICRQIVRENSESTNRRGCGIVAQPSDTGGSIVTVTLAAAKGKHTNN
jgi:signal transduction histidine kinase